MKNKLKTPLTLLLAFATCMTFAACTGQISSTDASSDYNTSSNEEATLAEISTSAITTAPAEDSATNATVTDAPVTDTPVTNAPVTNEPATTPETKAPAKDTTKTPETEAPVEDTTKAPETSAPEEETKAPETAKHILTIPPEDPSVDYYELGKYGFEKMLPEALPFSDEEANWLNIKFDVDSDSGSFITYSIISGNVMYSTDEERAVCYDILDEYANSLKKYGYGLYKTYRYWKLTDDLNNTILIALTQNIISIDITPAKV